MTIHGITLGPRPHEYLVPSEEDPTVIYHVYLDLQKCTCKGCVAHGHCKHLNTWVPQYLCEMEGGTQDDEEEEDDHSADAGNMVIPPHTQNGTNPASSIARWVKQIHGKDFIQYEGLLAMAHAQGLVCLTAIWISVTPELALAKAIAEFQGGRTFTECGDATPTNVAPQVKAHYARVALTRAKARVLRDALNIGMVAVEELEE